MLSKNEIVTDSILPKLSWIKGLSPFLKYCLPYFLLRVYLEIRFLKSLLLSELVCSSSVFFIFPFLIGLFPNIFRCSISRITATETVSSRLAPPARRTPLVWHYLKVSYSTQHRHPYPSWDAATCGPWTLWAVLAVSSQS